MGRFLSAALCNACWNKRQPDKPSRGMHEGPFERCHGCGRITTSGIYVRVDTEAEPAAEPNDPRVTQIMVETVSPGHEVVRVWLDHRLIGSLTVGEGEGATLELLLMGRRGK